MVWQTRHTTVALTHSLRFTVCQQRLLANFEPAAMPARYEFDGAFCPLEFQRLHDVILDCCQDLEEETYIETDQQQKRKRHTMVLCYVTLRVSL